MSRPAALIFDVFGTCVDWRGSVARDVAQAVPNVDAVAFADAWRAEYQPGMERVRSGGRGYVPLDDLHMENLAAVLQRFGVRCEDATWLNAAWERLEPWPDVVAGLNAVRARCLIAPCSNGSIAMMARLARHAGLPWDCILGADIARDYKPKPDVYLASCRAMRLDPGAVMMVAAHNDDLSAAAAAGLATAFVPRPHEHGPDQTSDLAATGDWDIVVSDFNELAGKL